jgi:hypothetical protein
MRHFALSGFRLGHTPLEVRLVYTGFLGFTLVGLVTIGLFQSVQIGVWLSEVSAYYRGGQTETAMTFPKTFSQLLEVTHFHAFIMGIVFLVVGHLVLTTGLSSRWKGGLLLSAFCGSMGDLAGGWLIRYVSAGFALLHLLAWLAFWGGYGGMLIATLWEMWGPSAEMLPPIGSSGQG